MECALKGSQPRDAAEHRNSLQAAAWHRIMGLIAAANMSGKQNAEYQDLQLPLPPLGVRAQSQPDEHARGYHETSRTVMSSAPAA